MRHHTVQPKSWSQKQLMIMNSYLHAISHATCPIPSMGLAYLPIYMADFFKWEMYVKIPYMDGIGAVNKSGLKWWLSWWITQIGCLNGGGEHGGWIFGRCDGKWFHWSEGNLSVIWLLGGISHREILHSTMDDLRSSVICSPCAKNACHPPKIWPIYLMEREKWWFGWMCLSSFLFFGGANGEFVRFQSSNR